MAEGMSMATGLPGVCLSTLGPGSTAVLNGVASATLDRVPMLAVSGCDGTRADSPAALQKALAGFDIRTRPLLIEARINPAQYEAQFA
jgi:thiamine pyrophosphate-dependent acetolactate synthase large subunit-like protein